MAPLISVHSDGIYAELHDRLSQFASDECIFALELHSKDVIHELYSVLRGRTRIIR